MKHIFVVDDEPRIRELIEMYLNKEGYQVTAFPDGKSALDVFDTLKPDLIVLDVNMPGMDGLMVCREIRKTSELPIIFCTARDEEIDRILGLEIGGDDYLTKPFSPRELVARIRNIFKRMERTLPPSDAISIGNLHVDGNRRLISTSNGELKLTTKEYELLDFLIHHPEMPFTREQLLERVWGYEYMGDLRAVDDLVKRIRKKLKDSGALATIETVWGYGYKITHTS